jgi:hypothetical protein
MHLPSLNGGSGQILKTFCEADSQELMDREDETVSIKILLVLGGMQEFQIKEMMLRK